MKKNLGKKRKRCPECGFWIRGKNHKTGDHHNKRVPSCRR